MSVTYPQFQYSNFPDEIDNFVDVQDANAELLPLINQYKNAFNDGDFYTCQEILSSHPELKAAMINAESINQVFDAIGALQLLFKEDIEKYLSGRVPQKIILSSSEPEGMAENDIWLKIEQESGTDIIVNFQMRNAEAGYDIIKFKITPQEIGALDIQTYDPDKDGKVEKADYADSAGTAGSATTASHSTTTDKLKTPITIGNAEFDGSKNISLEDIGAATSDQGTKADNAVPKTTTVNGKPLNSNITLDKADVGLDKVVNKTLTMSLSSTTLTITYA